MGYTDPSRHQPTEEQRDERERCRSSFRHFLRYWTFLDRETGQVRRFEKLWPGQEKFAGLMGREPWILALKAGKLGFTELECAYDAWVALFRQRNARVHIFSRDAAAAQDLLGYVRFGIERLPAWLRPRLDRRTLTQATLRIRMGADDVRAIVAYASGPNVSIDQSASHVHADELAHMLHPEATWGAIATTVAPSGSCHIVTRGHGDENFVATLWATASDGTSRLFPFFAPYTDRPGRDEGWREREASHHSNQALLFFAPESPEDALAGPDAAIYIPPAVWKQCFDPDLSELKPGDRTPLVIGVDASVTGDCFAVVAVSRHPQDREIAAIRAAKVWRPKDFAGGRIDFSVPDRFIRFLARGGCPAGHPRSRPLTGCRSCETGDFSVPPHNVVQVCIDPYQMESLAQELERDGVAWVYRFPQGSDREQADAGMLNRALRGLLKHAEIPILDEHVANCRAKLSNEADSKLRIVKAAPQRKVDAAVAASMAVHQCMYLLL